MFIKKFYKSFSEYFQRKFISKKSIRKNIQSQFVSITGYELNIDNPKSFNEKLQWLKLYYRNPLLTSCSDKYAVREYIKKNIGEEYLVPLLNVYKHVEDINFCSLPNKFVLKTNHGSGQNIICEKKDKFDWENAKKRLENWLRPESNHYFYSYEWSYKNIKPRIICEKFIENFNEDDLMDYKFMCFNGKVLVVFVCSDRKTSLKVDFFDLKWNKLPFMRFYPNSDKKIKKPKNFDLMTKLAEKLSKPFPFVRVDFYEVREKVYFGEMTFYPGNGMEPFTPIEWDYKLGKLLNLPK